MTRYYEVEPGVRLHYVVDDHADPWRSRDTVIMVHGFGESTEAWRGWVPYLSRDYRVVRFDMRGYGRSTPMPEDYAWSLDRLLQDLVLLTGYLGCEAAHYIGAKSGGSLVLQLAAQYPALVKAVVGVTPPVVGAAAVPAWRAQIESEGVLAWAKTTMPGRLGSGASREEVDWWVREVQGRTPRSTLLGYLKMVPGLDLRGEVAKIRCPALIITTTGSGLRTVDSVKAWQPTIAGSELLVIDGDAWHAAGAYPDACGRAAADFLKRRGGQPSLSRRGGPV